MQCPGGHVDHRVPVSRARLEQDDLRAILAQAIGEHAPRRPGPGDYILSVEFHFRFALSDTPRTPSPPAFGGGGRGPIAGRGGGGGGGCPSPTSPQPSPPPGAERGIQKR